MFETKFIYIILLNSDDLKFRIDRPQRMIILENLSLIYTARDKTWPNLKLFQYYIEWKKRLIQCCVKSEHVLSQIGEFYCWQ